MASKREVDALKTQLKGSTSKDTKRTPKKTKLLDISPDSPSSKRSAGRPRSRSRSRTPTRKSASRTVTPRVKFSIEKKEAAKKKGTPRSASKSQPESKARSGSKTRSNKPTPKSSSEKKRKSEANDNSSATKKAKASVVEEVRSPTRRSTRLAPKTVRSEQKLRNTSRNEESHSQASDNQSKGWLSYCTVM